MNISDKDGYFKKNRVRTNILRILRVYTDIFMNISDKDGYLKNSSGKDE